MSSLLDRSLGAITQQATQPSEPRGTRAAESSSAAGGQWSHDLHERDGRAAPRQERERNSRGGGGSPRLIISNLFYEVSETELELLFKQIGPIAHGPVIQYDNSGRSRGTAHVTYESLAHAIKAKEAFDGAPAKGHEIRVSFDYTYRPPVAPPAPGSLLARMMDPKPQNSFSNMKNTPRTHDAPRERRDPKSFDRDSRDSRDSRPARGGMGPTRGSRGAARGVRGGVRGGRDHLDGGRHKKEPKTSDDLDKELEAFMAAPTETSEVKGIDAGDVEMA